MSSYLQQVNKIRLYNYAAHQTSDSFNEPQEVSFCPVTGDVTDLLFFDRKHLIVTLSNGSVSVIRNEDNVSL